MMLILPVPVGAADAVNLSPVAVDNLASNDQSMVAFKTAVPRAVSAMALFWVFNAPPSAVKVLPDKFKVPVLMLKVPEERVKF